MPKVYHITFSEARAARNEPAKEYVQKLYWTLKDAGYSIEHARWIVEHGTILRQEKDEILGPWQASTVMKHMPKEAKGAKTSNVGRMGRKPKIVISVKNK